MYSRSLSPQKKRGDEESEGKKKTRKKKRVSLFPQVYLEILVMINHKGKIWEE